jgi:hypothetical protein
MRTGFRKSEIDVFIQDQDSPPFQYYLMREDKTDITLTSPVSKNDTVVSVSAGHGFTATGEQIVIMENGLWIQTEVKSVATNDITLVSPSGVAFTTGATVIRGVIDMNVDASGAEQEFVFNMRQSIIPIDVQCAHIIIWNVSVAGDDGKFGDLAALTNGVRFLKANTVDQNLGVYKSNSDFREFGAGVEYTDKSGAGTYAVNMVFRLKETYGIVIRIDPRTTDILKAVVRDKLDTLNRFRVSVIGQLTVGE